METPKNDTALATTEPAAGALSIPDFLKGDKEALALNTDFDQSELRVPQLKIVQSGTPERKRTDPNYIPGLEEGFLFNNASGRIYGPGPVGFTVLKFWVNYVKQKPLDDGGGMICRAPGGNCACSKDLAAGRTARGAQWGEQGEKPECTKYMNYLLWLVETQEVVWFSAKSTALGVMKQLNTSLRGISGIADFAKVFTLSTDSDKNGAGQEYSIPVIPRLPVAFISDQALYEKLKRLAIDVRDKNVDTSEAEADEADGVRTTEKVPF